MTVRSLDQMFGDAVASMLDDEFEGSDLEVNYVAGFGESLSQCEHGDLVLEYVYRLSVWVGRVGGGQFSVSGTVPMPMVFDGDIEPIVMLVREVCEQARFGLVMAETGEQVDQMVESDEDGS